MKKMRINSIALFGLASVLAVLSQSCTDAQDDTPKPIDNRTGIVCTTALSQGTETNGLKINLYVFSKEGTGDYQLSDSVSPVVSGDTRLTINPAELKRNDYRFLFIATPKTRQEIQVKRVDDTPLAFGTEWGKVSVVMLRDSMSVDNYYGITDLPGSEISAQGIINGDLKRMVGQMVFHFYKIGAGGITNPIPVDNPNVASVLDRVFGIELTYQNVPRRITFDADNQPVASATDPGTTLTNVVRFSTTGNGLKVNLPQPGVPVETSADVRGEAILKGTCLFPARDRVKVSMTFHYYDTTPTCEDTKHTHVATCYTPRTLSLNIPQNAPITGLSVIPDHFTINNAGIPCDRVIDIVHTSNITINTEWTNPETKEQP